MISSDGQSAPIEAGSHWPRPEGSLQQLRVWGEGDIEAPGAWASVDISLLVCEGWGRWLAGAGRRLAGAGSQGAELRFQDLGFFQMCPLGQD